MKSFLEECAEDILRKYGSSPDVCLVFPNNRTLLHFRKEYARLKNEVSFTGFMYPISKVLGQFLKASIPDELTLLMHLYKAFKEVLGGADKLNAKQASDFSLFYDSGRKILQDFNEIDNYLVDIGQLCHNCADINELEALYSYLEPDQVEIIRAFWASFSAERLSYEKQKFRELWISLPRVYAIFRDNLSKAGAMYSGMRNRSIYQMTRDGSLPLRFGTYIFVGFSVLNKCERGLFSYLRKAGRARFYWDADYYYISDKAQEAGLFMRGLLRDFPDELGERPPQNILGQPKDVEYIGVPLEVGQAKCVHDIIEDLSARDGYRETKTAVVLGDEHLLFPVLSSLPQCVSNVNVTMGYPFPETPVYSFLLSCLQLRKNFRASDKSGAASYYYNDVLSIINHPLVANIPDFYSRQIAARIRDCRMIRVPSGFLGSFSSIMSAIFCGFESEKSPADILQTFLTVLSELYFLKNPKPEDTPRLENEFIFNAYLSVKGLYNIILKLEGSQLTEDLVVSILKSHLLGIMVPFESQGDQGIQVMGMMETRNLDFDNVIMIGMNEGVFPKRSESSSFVTEGMRLAFDMPINKYKDAVFGYFFYRLFQRARNIRILYNNVFASSISGEPSRFAAQLLKEASQQERPDSKLRIAQLQFARNIKPVPDRDINVRSNPDTVGRLASSYSGKGAHSVSPSAINTFINCPLKFYFKYVARLSPIEQIQEEGTASDFGLILHSAIENIYKHIADSNGIVSADAINQVKNVAESFALNAYNDVFKAKKKSSGDLSGFETIFFDVLMQYIMRILDYDSSIAPFQLKGAEKGIYSTLGVPMSDGSTIQVNIGGTIDRIDRLKDGTVRIVDYKTGNVAGKMNFKTVEDIFDFTKASKRPSQALQVLLYSYVYIQKHPGELPEPVIYAVRSSITEDGTKFRVGLQKPQQYLGSGNIREYAEDFAVRLKNLLSQMLDPEQSFDPRPSQYCSTCDFKRFCKK